MSMDLRGNSLDERMRRLLDEALELDSDQLIAPACLPLLRSALEQGQTSNQGGKHLRAQLALTSFRLARREQSDRRPVEAPVAADESAMADLACAVEIYQTSALIHDDIMDDADLRRSKPSAHQALGQLTGTADLGRSLALMLGDLLATASLSIAQQAAQSLGNPQAILGCLLAMQKSVAIGQMLDMATELTNLDDPQVLADQALSVYEWKTASYTTIAPIELALLAAGTDPKTAHSQSRTIGLPLGIAFQLADDLLDVIPGSQSSGKPLGGDIREGKRTVLLADTLQSPSTTTQDQARLVSVFSKASRSRQDVEWVTKLYQRSGAIDRAHSRIENAWEQSRLAISTLPWKGESQDKLIAMCAHFVPTVET
ncbi:serralysin [Bifidobacterium aemilianum]|uniref:Serralysin n=1 Tax=Bifidobacterium aemilianum TaxID=2493120 RepID=A0A366KAD8_9BIFI|nr:polyprenyl synthetase family protein [Bifidobacterium aemilianum]RBP98202.1 serralysin [Bifidobacterium aemilianum]